VISSGRSGNLLNGADDDAVRALRGALEDDGVTFVTGATILEVGTLRRGTTTATMGGGGDGYTLLPLMKVSYTTKTRHDNGDNDKISDETRTIDVECDCLLVAMGRVANVDSLGLDDANVECDPINGILVDEQSKSITNPNVYAVGDCVAHVPRLTHGEDRLPSPPQSHVLLAVESY
jgi:pyruvate/2-oxoglutarate dehydrogenase complex dihydrolipoamide dehydrogenase (E3) component